MKIDKKLLHWFSMPACLPTASAASKISSFRLFMLLMKMKKSHTIGTHSHINPPIEITLRWMLWARGHSRHRYIILCSFCGATGKNGIVREENGWTQTLARTQNSPMLNEKAEETNTGRNKKRHRFRKLKNKSDFQHTKNNEIIRFFVT